MVHPSIQFILIRSFRANEDLFIWSLDNAFLYERHKLSSINSFSLSNNLRFKHAGTHSKAEFTLWKYLILWLVIKLNVLVNPRDNWISLLGCFNCRTNFISCNQMNDLNLDLLLVKSWTYINSSVDYGNIDISNNIFLFFIWQEPQSTDFPLWLNRFDSKSLYKVI